ncbi:MAG: CDP-alcohol phosphatidyltransferase family protein [Dysgonamonadaceae bacterium]|jgi:CDP-diacylglycerol--glycerol-3-phosphate 3-phosphatidyltransferase|nr:CDP-alcohol phosphatidyltransferase family protein [Dysgonamonadaceae bacterium]
MISIYNIKPKFQQFLLPVLQVLHKRSVTANQITMASLILSLLIGVLFWFAADYPVLFLALPIGLFIRMALNALDGMMARTYNQQSKGGEVLNELGDVVSDLFIYFPLLRFEGADRYWVIAFICFSIVNEFAGILGKAVSGQRRYEGPMGKSDRAFVMGVYGLLCFFHVGFRPYSGFIFSFLLLLLLISTFTRVKKTLSD